MLGAPTESTWPGFSALPNATAVRWKAQAHSRLRDAFPNASFAGKPQLSHTGLSATERIARARPGPTHRRTRRPRARGWFFCPEPPDSGEAPNRQLLTRARAASLFACLLACAQYFKELPLAVQQSQMTTVPSRVGVEPP